MMPPLAIVFFTRGLHLAFRLEPEGPQIGQQMSKDLELIGHRETIELQHDRRIKRRDVAMPDVAGDAGKEDRGVTALEAAHHRQFRDAMALSEIFAKEECVDAGGVATHDHVLVVVGENLRLNKVTRAEKLGHGVCLAHGTERTLPEAFATR